jgi:hypothetical protein
MADITTEMNMPIISAPALGVTGDVTASMAQGAPAISYDDAADATIAVGSPVGQYDPSTITVYSNSITPVSYGGSDEVACFDVVFSVGINCEGVSKTYQVVKRIGIDKCRIASEAACSTPVSIVESKSEALKEEAAATRKRFRRLAGLE